MFGRQSSILTTVALGGTSLSILQEPKTQCLFTSQSDNGGVYFP